MHKKEGSGWHAHYRPLPPIPWKDTKTSSQVLHPDFDTSTMTNNYFHQVESFFAQSGNDRVHLQDFVVFGLPSQLVSASDSESMVSNMSQ